MTLIPEAALKVLVDRHYLSRVEASKERVPETRTLPAPDELKRGYYNCARELGNETEKCAEQLGNAFQSASHQDFSTAGLSKTNIQKLTRRLEDCAKSISICLLQIERVGKDLDRTYETSYVIDLEAIIRFRNGEKDFILFDESDGLSEPFKCARLCANLPAPIL